MAKKDFPLVFQHLSVPHSWGKGTIHCCLSASTASCTEWKKKLCVGFSFHTQRLNGQIVHTRWHSKSFWGHLEVFHHCNCFSFSSAHSSAPPTSLGLPPLPPSEVFFLTTSQESPHLILHTEELRKKTCPNSVSCRVVVFSLAFRLLAPNEDLSIKVLLLLNSTGYLSPFSLSLTSYLAQNLSYWSIFLLGGLFVYFSKLSENNIVTLLNVK